MEKLNTLLKFTFCVLAIVLIAGNRSLAQNDSVGSKDVDLAQRQLENVRIEEENIGALLSHFSFAYGIPIGLEIARNGDELAVYRIDFKKGTLSDLLTELVAEHTFTLRVEGRTQKGQIIRFMPIRITINPFRR